VARVAADENDEDERRVDEGHDAGDEVGYQHAGQDKVCLGPESGRQPDRDQRKPVAAEVEYGQDEDDADPHDDQNCWQHDTVFS